MTLSLDIVSKGIMFSSCLSAMFIRSFGQILLPRERLEQS